MSNYHLFIYLQSISLCNKSYHLMPFFYCLPPPPHPPSLSLSLFSLFLSPPPSMNSCFRSCLNNMYLSSTLAWLGLEPWVFLFPNQVTTEPAECDMKTALNHLYHMTRLKKCDNVWQHITWPHPYVDHVTLQHGFFIRAPSSLLFSPSEILRRLCGKGRGR